MDLVTVVIGLIIGLAAGTLGGMFGIGGGLLMVPLMAWLLHFSQHKAQGTSLAVLVVPVALPAVINYYKQGNMDPKIAAIIALGFLGGGYLGSKISLSLDENVIKKLFAVFLVAVAIQFWIKGSQPKANPQPAAEPSHSAPTQPD
jgi:uncharacterized membrane protein YfcA